MTRTLVKLEGSKVFARNNAEDAWTHIETINDARQAEMFAEDIGDDPVKRAEYITDPLSEDQA